MIDGYIGQSALELLQIDIAIGISSIKESILLPRGVIRYPVASMGRNRPNDYGLGRFIRRGTLVGDTKGESK